jgi:hypothetical protein
MDLPRFETGTLLRIVLLLLGIWLALQILEGILRLTFGLLRILPFLIAVAIVIYLALWLADRL